MPRVLLIVPSSTYRAHDFLAAAHDLGTEVVLGSDVAQTLAPAMGDRAVVLVLDDIERSVDAIEALHRRHPIDAVIAVDDKGTRVAAAASARLGFAHNSPDAVARTRDKLEMRRAFAAADVPQPAFEPDQPVELPVVVKPTGGSASQGVIRADSEAARGAAIERVRGITANGNIGGGIIVEEYVPGDEIALEGILERGRLTVLAIFDKPDPLVGPYSEETIYVTPSRLPEATVARIIAVVGHATEALGLTEGPIHAELRIDGDRIAVLEIAARSIGGLCGRTLAFGAGVSLEAVILAHALGRPLEGLQRPEHASGVMMLPIPRAGTLDAITGQGAARAVSGIVGLEITVPIGRSLAPPPEGGRYLGFLFARANTPEAVEAALRAGFARLDIIIR